VNRCFAEALRTRPFEKEKVMAATKSSGSKRGFAAMDPAKQREIASKGGKASHGGGRPANSSR
jgi:general stress protein YciG